MFQTKFSEFHHSYIHHILLFRVFSTVSLDNDVNLFFSQQMDEVFAAGDLGEALNFVEAMEAAGLEAADARDKLTRVMAAVKKVTPHCNPQIEPFWFDKF